jgi:hypothetical protein
MDIRTGETIFDNIISLDINGNPLSAATFNTIFFINGIVTTNVVLSINLSCPATATFNASFSSSTYGYHQYRVVNNLNGVVYMSEVYVVKPDNELAGGAIVYVGI